MSTYRVAQVAAPGGRFEVVEREVPQPGPGHVRIAVDACGVCHSDVFFVNAGVPGVRFPVVPGHEIAGRIEELGEGTQDSGLAGGRPGGGGLVRRQLRPLHALPAGRLHRVREPEGPRMGVRRRVRRGGDRSGRRAGPDPRRAGRAPMRRPWAVRG